MKATIAIVNYNTRDFLDKCLNSIYKYGSKYDFEVVVIDNNSSDGSKKMVRNKYSEVKLITNSKNLGYAAAVNQAIKVTDSDYIILLNSDAEVFDKSIDNIIDYLENNPEIGIVGPKIVDSFGNPHLSCRRFPSFKEAAMHVLIGIFWSKNPYSKRYKMMDFDHDKEIKIDWVSGSCMGIRRKALNEVGLFDERYYMYVEDLDLCKRMWNAEWEVRYFPGATIIHYIGGSTKGLGIGLFYQQQKSVFRYFLKNYGNTWRVIFTPLLAVGLGFRILIFSITKIYEKFIKKK